MRFEPSSCCSQVMSFNKGLKPLGGSLYIGYRAVVK